jgi:hypothetical protein
MFEAGRCPHKAFRRMKRSFSGSTPRGLVARSRRVSLHELPRAVRSGPPVRRGNAVSPRPSDSRGPAAPRHPIRRVLHPKTEAAARSGRRTTMARVGDGAVAVDGGGVAAGASDLKT